MTVSRIPPKVTYYGNGVATTFTWYWDMIEDSSIEVLVDNEYADDLWSLQVNAIVFSTPPANGVEIIIYRRTKIWMPENYRIMGKFAATKTEASMDRQTMIAAERNGTAIVGEPPNGIVGGADLHGIRGEYDYTLVSEAGDDAVIPIWSPDDTEPPEPPPPDPNILWAGPHIYAGLFATIPSEMWVRFTFNVVDGEAQAEYQDYNDMVNVPWLNITPIAGAWWCRMTPIDGTVVQAGVKDGIYFRDWGEAFPMLEKNGYSAALYLSTYGLTAPATVTQSALIEICADEGGLPNENWVGRTVTVEGILNV